MNFYINKSKLLDWLKSNEFIGKIRANGMHHFFISKKLYDEYPDQFKLIGLLQVRDIVKRYYLMDIYFSATLKKEELRSNDWVYFYEVGNQYYRAENG